MEQVPKRAAAVAAFTQPHFESQFVAGSREANYCHRRERSAGARYHPSASTAPGAICLLLCATPGTVSIRQMNGMPRRPASARATAK